MTRARAARLRGTAAARVVGFDAGSIPSVGGRYAPRTGGGGGGGEPSAAARDGCAGRAAEAAAASVVGESARRQRVRGAELASGASEPPPGAGRHSDSQQRRAEIQATGQCRTPASVEQLIAGFRVDWCSASDPMQETRPLVIYISDIVRC